MINVVGDEIIHWTAILIFEDWIVQFTERCCYTYTYTCTYGMLMYVWMDGGNIKMEQTDGASDK